MEDFHESILGRIILVYNCYSEQSVCNLTKARNLKLVYSTEIFENEWLWKAASEQSEVAVCNMIQFLTIKTISVFFYNVTLNVNIEFLKTVTLEPILSIE